MKEQEHLAVRVYRRRYEYCLIDLVTAETDPDTIHELAIDQAFAEGEWDVFDTDEISAKIEPRRPT